MSNEVTIEQMNEVIARFMGGVKQIIPKGGLHGYKEGTVLWMYLFSDNADPVRSLEFNTSWDWLMPVVEKIETLENKRFGVCIDVLDTMIMDYKVGFDEGEKIIVQTDIYPDSGDTKISITHDAVYQFITWYNDNQQKQNDEHQPE